MEDEALRSFCLVKMLLLWAQGVQALTLLQVRVREGEADNAGMLTLMALMTAIGMIIQITMITIFLSDVCGRYILWTILGGPSTEAACKYDWVVSSSLSS